MKNKIIWIILCIILFIAAISYLATLNSVEEPFENQGLEKASYQEVNCGQESYIKESNLQKV